jgi:hypothetical protein
MAAQYFEKFPEISYSGVRVRDVTRRVNFLKQTINNPYVFLPYTIEEGDRAEDVAYHYYGDPSYVWLVYLANNIIDPYHEWPFDEETFHRYLIDKYSAQSGRKDWDVIAWAQDQTREDNVVYYYREIDEPTIIFPERTLSNLESPSFKLPVVCGPDAVNFVSNPIGIPPHDFALFEYDDNNNLTKIKYYVGQDEITGYKVAELELGYDENGNVAYYESEQLPLVDPEGFDGKTVLIDGVEYTLQKRW